MSIADSSMSEEAIASERKSGGKAPPLARRTVAKSDGVALPEPR
jgi:hypothetical protein